MKFSSIYRLLYVSNLLVMFQILQSVAYAIPPHDSSGVDNLRVAQIQAQNVAASSPTTAVNILEDAITDYKLTNKNDYFLASAIRSISGEKPANEFFDIYFVFHYLGKKRDDSKIESAVKLFSIVGIDVALSNVQTDSVGSTQKKLSEAGISWNVGFNLTEKGDRELYSGLTTKIFNGIPYWGLHVGSIETNSTLLGSYFSAGLLWSLIPPNKAIVDESRQFHRNIYIEFAVHSPQISFLKYVRIKGGILIPWATDERAPELNDIQHRITIEVPAGGIFTF